MKIGVLALQGDFAEHIRVLERTGVGTAEVRLPEHLDALDGLIIPGGESTTIGKLAAAYGLMAPLRQFGRQKAVWGTCAGAIFLAKDTFSSQDISSSQGISSPQDIASSQDNHRNQPLLRLMDIVIERNAFGRQVDSFEIDLDVPALRQVSPHGGPYHAVFIRAPLIAKVEKDAQVLAKLPDERIVAAQQGRLLATSFHPELTGDDRFHRYFLNLVD